MKKKTILVCTSVIMLTLAGGLNWLRLCGNRHAESSWRWFAEHIREGDLERAYAYMTDSYRQQHTLSDFTVSPWCDSNNVVNASARHAATHLVYVRRFNPFGSRARLVLTNSILTLPLPLEDGLTAVITEMKKEEEYWRVTDSWDTIMR
jgi:hypothetical protein